MTIEDVRDPSCLSGFRHVGYQRDKATKPYHAQIANFYGKGKNWYGPWRNTPEAAAQDYLDKLAATPLTIEDIRNPARKSGFDHVSSAGTTVTQRRTKQYRAQANIPKDSPVGHQDHSGYKKWRGPGRATPEEAAQDYCDFINAQRVTPATPALKTAGHAGRRRDSLSGDPEVEAALGVLRDAKGQRQGKQGFVYCILETEPGGGMRHVKVGYSTNPQARVAELQTGNPRVLKLHAMKKGTLTDEAALHAKYIDQNVLQEWFRPTKELLLEFDLDGQTGLPWGQKGSAS